MIFCITWEDGRIDYCTAQDQLHLLKSYDAEYELCLDEIESIEEVPIEEAKKIVVNFEEINDGKIVAIENSEGTTLDELAFYQDRFCIIASNQVF